MASNTQTPSAFSQFLATIFRRKNLDQMLAASENQEHKLNRTLTAMDLVLFGVGAMIGSGIFVATGAAAAGADGHLAAGPALTVSYALTGLICAFCALAYAEFATMVPLSGSAYTYTYSTMGQIVAWVIGWALVLEYAVGNMAVAVGWTGHVKEFLMQAFHVEIPAWLVSNTIDTVTNPSSINMDILMHSTKLNLFGHEHYLLFYKAINLPSMIIVLMITGLLYVGVQESARTAALMVFLKTAVVLLFIAIGSMFILNNQWEPIHQNWFGQGMTTFAPNGWNGVVTGASTIFFAYIGFDAVSTVAEETKNPQRDIPIGILGSLAICTVLYILVSAVVTGVVPLDKINKEAAVAGAAAFMGIHWATLAITIGGIAGLTSVLLVMQLGATRILMAISRDGLLPAVLAKVHPKFKTPHINTVIVGSFVALFSGLLPITLLTEMCNIGTLAAFVVVCLGVIVLRFTDPGRPRPFKCPGGIVLPIIGILGCLYITTGLPSLTWALFIVWFVLGLVIYFFYGLPNSRRLESGEPPAPSALNLATAL
jgi:basic amino acid/polyamine antiporter, APA family